VTSYIAIHMHILHNVPISLHYYVASYSYSSEGEIISTETLNETFLYKHLDCFPINTFTVNIIVINSERLHSNTTMKTVVIQSRLQG